MTQYILIAWRTLLLCTLADQSGNLEQLTKINNLNKKFERA